MNTKLMRIYEDLTFKEAKDNDVKRENANIDGNTAMGTMLKYGPKALRNFIRCMSSIQSMRKLMRMEIFTFTIWTSTP